MTSHFSLDIETLDTRATAVVLSIGICKFDPKGVAAVGPICHVSLEVAGQTRNHRTISSDTFYWWADQLVSMEKSPFPRPFQDPASALSTVIDFIYGNSEPLEKREGETQPYQDVCIWVRGPHFDWTILDNLAGQVGVVWPVRFDRVRDQRTFCAGETYDPPENGEVFVAHSAVDDAMMQAMFIQQVTAKHADEADAKRAYDELCDEPEEEEDLSDFEVAANPDYSSQAEEDTEQK